MDILGTAFMYYFVFIVIGLGIIIGLIPTAIAFFLYRRLRKKGKLRRIVGGVILVGVIVWTIVTVYQAFYPGDSFYRDEFETNTTYDFPASADILEKYASYPDFHGDYESISLMRTNSGDYDALLKKASTDKRFEIIKLKDNIQSFPELESNPMVPIVKAFAIKGTRSDEDIYIYFGKNNIIVFQYYSR